MITTTLFVICFIGTKTESGWKRQSYKSKEMSLFSDSKWVVPILIASERYGTKWYCCYCYASKLLFSTEFVFV